MVLCGETEDNVGRLYEDKTKKAVWSHIVKVFVKVEPLEDFYVGG